MRFWFGPSNLSNLRPSNLSNLHPSNLPTFPPSDLHTFPPSDLLAFPPPNLPIFPKSDLPTFPPLTNLPTSDLESVIFPRNVKQFKKFEPEGQNFFLMVEALRKNCGRYKNSQTKYTPLTGSVGYWTVTI